MDDFLEQTAIRRKQGGFMVLYGLCWAVIVVFGFLALFSLSKVIGADPNTGKLSLNWRALGVFLVTGVIAFLCWRGRDNCRVEYDYTFTNGILDISRVMNDKRRRYLCEMQMREVARCGPAQGPAFTKALSEPGVKRHNWFLNRDSKLHFFYFTKKGEQHIAILELNDEMIAVIRSKNYLAKDAWYDADGRQDYGRSISR